MKISLRLLTLTVLLSISFQETFSQSEAIKKELQSADSKYLSAQDYAEAKKIYLKYAEHLTPQQQTYLASCYYADPMRSQENYAEGMKLLLKAAGRGNTEAMRSIAYCYENGLGVKKDSIQQISWTKKAADYGDPAALLTVAYYYQLGWGLPKDHQMAKEMYLKAIDKGSNEASYYYALMERDNGNLTSSLHYLEKSAKKGFVLAQFALGEMYQKGIHGVTSDLDEATRWYGKIDNSPQNRTYYNSARLMIRSFGKTEPSTDLKTVKPLLLKLVSRANESFYDLKGKLINPYNKPPFDNLGSSKNEYYAPLLQLGFKNGYIRRDNFNQVQKNKSVKNVDNYSYFAEIIHSSSKETSYRVYTEWAGILKSVFPDWKLSEKNFPDLKQGTTTLYQHHSNGRTTVIELKTCCPNDKVQIEIMNRHNPQ